MQITIVQSKKTTYTEVGMGLSLGLRYFVHKNISFAVETTIDYTQTEVESKNSHMNTGAYPSSGDYKTTSELTDLKITPISVLSFNVHF